MRFHGRDGSELYELEAIERGCYLFDLGGKVSGTSGSLATQDTSVQFIPSVNQYTPSPPVVSVYPAGQGLATVNTAYPASAAWLPSTYPATATSSSTLTSLLPYLLIVAAAAFAGYMLLGKKRR